jgi:protein-tyrosine phosphatase
MAEGALRARIGGSVLAERIQVDSAGTGGWHVGEPPDRRAVACASRHGVDISGLRARQLQKEDFDRFDWILCADVNNLRDARRIASKENEGKLALLLDWARLGRELEVPDPYYGDLEDFEQVWQLVDSAAQSTVARLLETH